MVKNRIVCFSLIVVAMTLLEACRRDPFAQGVRALEKDDAARAQSLLQRAVDLDPQDPSALANLGLAYLRQGQTNEALQSFQQASGLAPEDSRPLEFMAAIAAGQEQWKTAAGYLAEAVRRAPQSPSVQNALAVAELHVISPQAARTRLEAVLGMAPNYSPAVFNLALINRQLKNMPEARKLFLHYLKISTDPERLAVVRRLTTDEESASVPATTVPSRAPKGPGKASEPAAVSQQTPAIRRPQVAAEAYNRGVRSHTAGDFERAIQEYTRALQNDPTMANAHYNLGLVFKARNEMAKARSALQQALVLAPDMADARYMLALVLRDMKDPGACIAELNVLLEKNPKYAPAHHALGQLYKNDPAKSELAKREFSRYLELAPDGPSAREARNWLKYNPLPGQ